MVDLERIEQARNYPILDLAQRSGIEIRNRTCRCINPMHEDKNPSMSFDKKTNRYKCFSCEFRGDTIELVMEVNKFSFQGAIDWILGSEACQSLHVAHKAPIQALKEGSGELRGNGEKYSDIYKFFINMLPFPDENSYLVKERGLLLEVLKENNIKVS